MVSLALYHTGYLSEKDIGHVKLHWGPTKGACSMAVPGLSTRPRTSALRMPSAHPAIRNANHR